jgi:hypothetical protein
VILATVFQKRNSEKVNHYGRLIIENCRQRKTCLLKVSPLLEDESQCSRLSQMQLSTFMFYVRAKSCKQWLQLLVKLIVTEVYLLCIFLTTTITCWNSCGVYATYLYSGGLAFDSGPAVQNYVLLTFSLAPDRCFSRTYDLLKHPSELITHIFQHDVTLTILCCEGRVHKPRN